MTRLVSLSTRDCQSFKTTPRGMSMLTSAEDSAAPGTLIRMDRMPGAGASPVLHKEPLEFEHVHPSKRSYK